MNDKESNARSNFPPLPQQQMYERPRGRGASFWVAIFVSVLFLFSVVLNFFLLLAVVGLATGVGGAPSGLKEVSIMGQGGDKILRIPIKGIILEEDPGSFMGMGVGMVEMVRLNLKEARLDDDIKGILLEIDSPGGGVTASDTILSMLTRFQEERDIPIYSCIKDLGASGGYYVAMASQKIFAHPTTITGSIGVIMRFINYAGLLDKVGLEDVKIISKSTPYKDIGSPSRDMREDERKLLLDIIDEMYNRFVDVVNKGRKALDREAVQKLADGRIYTGAQAKEAGLVDEIGYAEDAVHALREAIGEPNARVIEYRIPAPGLLDLLVGEVRGPSVFDKLRVESGIEGLVRRKGPMALYLWTGY